MRIHESNRSITLWIVALVAVLSGPAVTPAAAQTGAAASAPSFEVYSKYDFVPGEKVVAAEDFTQDAIGDFPAKWDTSASGESVTLAGKANRRVEFIKR